MTAFMTVFHVVWRSGPISLSRFPLTLKKAENIGNGHREVNDRLGSAIP
jgi:hypothetical protein